MPGSAIGANVPGDTEVEGRRVHRRGLHDRVRRPPHGPDRDRRALAIGEDAALRDTIVWPGTQVDPGTVLIGAVAGDRPLADKLG